MNKSLGEAMLGVDLGTTAVKVSAFEIGGTRTFDAAEEYPLLHPQPGWEVQDPIRILAALDACLAQCCADITTAELSPVGVALSSAMHGLIGLDAELRPVTELITWADSRAADVAAEVRGTERGIQIHAQSGTPIHSMSPLMKIMWFHRHDPELAARVRWWVGLKDWVVLHLTGELVTELSCASATGLLDIQTRSWSQEILEWADIDPGTLPPVRDTTATYPLLSDVSHGSGLPDQLPVILGAGDGPLGNLGTGAIESGVAGLSLGTSGAVRMVTDRPEITGGGALFCYALTNDVWVRGGAISNGGVVGRWVAEVFCPDLVTAEGTDDRTVLERAAAVPAGSDGLVMLPYLMAERAPLWDPSLRGAYLGVRRQHTAGHFVRAALEGVSGQLGLIVRELERFEPVTSVRATGGTFRSDLWRRVVTAGVGKPVTFGDGSAGTARGAAALGLIAIGRASTLTEALAQLCGRDDPETLQPDVELVTAAEQTRRQVLALVDDLLRIREAWSHTPD